MATRKKLSELTPIERSDRIMKHSTWDEAEQAGIEILARCMAKRVYAEGKGVNYMTDLLNRICIRADEWKKDHTFELACAKLKYEKEKESMNLKNEKAK